MASFKGTSGNDNFTGADDVSDVFNFTLVNLSALDTVIGGDGSSVDILNVQSGGALTPALLAGVRGIERILLQAPGIALTLNDSVAAVNGKLGQLYIQGSNGADTVDGSGLSAANRLHFAAGNGDDSFGGGAGDDNVIVLPDYLNAADTFNGGAGVDTLHVARAGSIIAFSLSGLESFERIALMVDNITLYLSDAAILGNNPSGLLTIQGSAGRDRVDGSTLTAARISVSAGTDNDFLNGGANHDTLSGGNGDDQINSGGGGQSFGGNGNDKLTGGGALHGDAGNDNLEGLGAADMLSGGLDDDYFYGGAGADTILGDAGNDFIEDSPGKDSVDGGAGIDTISIYFLGTHAAINYAFSSANGTKSPLGSTLFNIEAVNVTGGDGYDTLRGGAFDDKVRGWFGNDLLFGNGGNDFIIGEGGIDTILGGDGNDTLSGNASSDTLDGGAGNDMLIGGRPLDTIPGDNMLIGGAGADTLEGGVGITTISFETSAEGVYVDFLRGRGFGGDAQGDVYRGVNGLVYLSNFNDLAIGGLQLFGLAGDDTLVQTPETLEMTGGAGADSFEIGFNFDVVFQRLRLLDFDAASGDIIDLSRLDAHPAAGNQAFSFIGTAEFTTAPGQVRFEVESGETIVELQMKAGEAPEYTFALVGAHTLTAADFAL